MTAFTGRDFALSIGYGAGASTFERVGRATSKTYNSTLDTIDVTADDSPGQRREYIESYIGDTFSFSVFTGTDAARASVIDDLEVFYNTPSSQAQIERKITVELVRPKSDAASVAQIRTYVFDAIITGFNREGTNDAAVSFSIDLQVTGDVTITDAAAPV